ncbi:MAG: SpoIVB peptidase [Oscillospiraceae bacterium]|nr:SpoIVB peptidase [Oscillospiraceae bacterium]
MDERKKSRRRLACAVLAVAFALCTALSSTVLAAPQEGSTKTLVPMGCPVGIKLFAKGVLVVDLAREEDALQSTAALACGLKTGDVVVSANGEELRSTEQLQALLQRTKGESVCLSVRRGGRLVELTAMPQCGEDGVYRLGAWIRDSIAGIGTMTFYDPATRTFAALGHGVTDTDTAMLMPLASGAVMEASVKAVKAGAPGSPGEMRGDFDLEQDMGTLYANTDCGIFGTLGESCEVDTARALPVASREDVRTGRATILSTVQGETAQEYEVLIEKIYSPSTETRNLLVRVTDDRLLEKTGGIVQGMSGSPIIQNGKLVGAVTHVLVNDPTRGYGIFIENMLEAAK